MKNDSLIRANAMRFVVFLTVLVVLVITSDVREVYQHLGDVVAHLRVATETR